ncbi:copper homeostasis protein CutC [Leifsonia shinshuensis]|uniref:PF03932 family protein CutC n=1 Tax=Leifsonia shinshuensis TaxID=150026 RepID=A0A7G6YGR0_9MICO|nr:copper homeostasis protein CutC [Leifsonia shinshuensis]
MLVEVCLEDLAGVRLAEAAGADRIELCSALSDGGLTPSIGTVAAALRLSSRMGVTVLIRQRAGDFVFDADELAAMVADIHAVRALPNPNGVAVGFAVGALRPDGSVDAGATAALVAACGEAPVTFHKAFDQVPDRAEALEVLVGLGVARVLTSGGSPSAVEGADALAALVAQAGDRIAVLAGGGVRPVNAAELVRRSGVREVHLRAVTTVASGSQATSRYDTGEREVTSSAIVAAAVDAVRGVAA